MREKVITLFEGISGIALIEVSTMGVISFGFKLVCQGLITFFVIQSIRNKDKKQ